MDTLDNKIIQKLMQNSRSSFRKIAQELGVTTDTIIRRFEKLKNEGVIKPTISIDLFELGYGVRVWYMISLENQTNPTSVINKISKIEDVCRIITAVGDYDLLVVAAVKDFKHMFEIGQKINKIDGVTDIEARPYLPSKDERITKSAASGFFNAKILETNQNTKK